MQQHAPEACAAFVGLDWAASTQEVCRHAAGSATRAGCILPHTPAALDAWGSPLRTRCNGQPLAICRARNTGPLVSAVRTHAVLPLFPLHPLPLARSRDACTPRRATDDPTDAARPLALRLPHRDTLPPLTPQRPAMRALAHRVAHRRRVVDDRGRSTHRRTRTRKNAVPHVRQWLQDQAPPVCGDGLRRWPTLTAAPRARRATLAPCLRDHHGRAADGLDTRLQARQTARPLTPDAGLSAPHALLVPALVSPRRVPVPAREDCDPASAQRA